MPAAPHLLKTLLPGLSEPLAALLDPARGALAPPLRAEIFGIERFEQHGRSLGQVQGLFSGSDFWALSLTSEPWSDRRFSPFLSVGLGKFRNIPNTSLVSAATSDAKLAHATLGLRWHLGERFVARVDASLYTAFVADNRSAEYRAFTAGIAFFF